jgi:subtilisin family serine protease
LHDKIISLFFTVLLLSSVTANFNSVDAQIEYEQSVVLSEQQISKFDSGFYEIIQNKVELSENSSVTLSADNYHDVIFVVSKPNDESSQKNKDNLEKILQEIGVTEIYKAEILSFVTARIPINEIHGLTQQSYIQKIGDGEEQMQILDNNGADNGVKFTNLFEAKNIVNANDLAYSGIDTNVAVIDTGINENHSDLKNKVILEARCVGSSCIKDKLDADYHGTVQAGIISATSSDSLMNGVAISTKLFDLFSITRSASFAGALDYALTQGADIANVAITDVSPFCNKYEALSILIDEAIDKGMLIVSAVGNGDDYKKLNPDTNSMLPLVYDISCSLNTINSS